MRNLTLRKNLILIGSIFCLIFSLASNSYVIAKAKPIKINKTIVTLLKGNKVQLKLIGTKSKAKWTSSDTKIAIVNSKGLVTAKSKGKATIKAKLGKKTYSCKVTVTDRTNIINLKVLASYGTEVETNFIYLNTGAKFIGGVIFDTYGSQGTISEVTYINKNYSKFIGTLALTDDQKNTSNTFTIIIYNEIDEVLYESPEISSGSFPTKFSIDINDCSKVKIVCYADFRSFRKEIALGNGYFIK